MKKFDVLIGGYYGCKNIGDEAILDSMCKSFREHQPYVRICVLSASPAETSRRLGVASVKRSDPAAVIRAMCASEAYISGGGGLLQDTTSRRSLLYYAALMLLGKLICGRLCVFANGIGRLKNTFVARAALKAADRISVRDPMSLERLCEMGIERDQMILSADPALLLSGDGSSAAALRSCGIGRRKYFAVSLRDFGGEFNMKALERFIKTEDAVPLFVSMEDESDLEICSTAAARCGGAVLQPKNYSQLLSVLEGAEFAVGMRLHFLIAAAAAGIPFGALSYDVKTDAFMEYADVDAVVRADSISADAMFCLRSKMSAADGRRMEELRQCARRDAVMLSDSIFHSGVSTCSREKVENIR